MKLAQAFNSEFGVLYSNFLSLTSAFWKVEKYTPTFSGRQHFYFNFQSKSENPEIYKYVGDKNSESEFENWLAGHICHKDC